MTKPTAHRSIGTTGSTDAIEQAARWLANLPHTPDDAVDLLVRRFDLRAWEARKAVDRARRMRMLRSAFA